MNIFTKTLLLGFSIGLANAAMAEPFNDRGGDFIAQVHSGPQDRYPVVGSLSNHFNNRGEDFIAHVQSGSQDRYPVVAVISNAFNDRGDDGLASAPVDSERLPSTAGFKTPQAAVRFTAASY